MQRRSEANRRAIVAVMALIWAGGGGCDRDKDEVARGKSKAPTKGDDKADAASDKPSKGEPSADPPDGGDSRWRGKDTGDEYFVLEVSGPAFPEPQMFSIDPDRIDFDLLTSAFTMRFQDGHDRTSTSEQGAALEFFTGGGNFGTFDKPGSYEMGPANGGSNGWSLRIWKGANECAPNFAGCDGIAMKTGTGTLEVAKLQLGKAASRPHAEGPSVLAGTFDVTAQANDSDHEGESYHVEGTFSLID